MLIQARRIDVLCVSLMMAATGTVCPKKKAAVVADSVTDKDDQLALPSQPAFQSKFAMLAANAIMLTLKQTFVPPELLFRLRPALHDGG